jgi:hypothetical protein
MPAGFELDPVAIAGGTRADNAPESGSIEYMEIEFPEKLVAYA